MDEPEIRSSVSALGRSNPRFSGLPKGPVPIFHTVLAAPTQGEPRDMSSLLNPPAADKSFLLNNLAHPASLHAIIPFPAILNTQSKSARAGSLN
jgi:hypothetical protein